MSVDFVTVDWDGRAVDIEYRWLGREAAQPLLVFLHEGLGSLSMWKDFPAQLCAAAGCSGLVYSRPGYGRSTPRPAGTRWAPDFMHRQARELLPALLDALVLDRRETPLWLFGHSDGGSIALLYAAAYPAEVAGLVVMAPHVMVEDVSIASIRQARCAYLETDLRARLGRYHDDPDSAFWGWNDIWLDPAFRGWTIEAEIDAIECPLLALQGIDDEYGTLEQVRAIGRRLPRAEVVELENCGHSPQRDQPRQLVELCRGFLERHSAADGAGFSAQSQI